MADYKTVELWAESESFPGELDFIGAVVLPESVSLPEPGRQIHLRYGATNLEPEELPV